MSEKKIGAAVVTAFVLLGCGSGSGGGGGGSSSLIPPAVVQALESCTQLRGIALWELLDALTTEIQDDATLPIEVDLDGDGIADLTVDGSIVFTSATGGTVDWSLSGALTGSGNASFELIGASLSVSGNGSFTGLDGCVFAFSIAPTEPLAISVQGLDGSLDFSVTTLDGTTLSGSLIFTLGDATVGVTNVRIAYVDPLGSLIEETVADFSFEIPGFGGEPPASGDIVFAAKGSNEIGDGDFELWSMNADGSAPAQLTFNEVEDFYPAVSPDGGSVAFVRGPSTGGAGTLFEGELFLMDAGGTNVRPLTSFGESTLVEAPAWSANGSRIVFAVPFGSQRGIFVLDPDDPGGTMHVLVDGNGQPGFHSPSFSSDGAHVAYSDDSTSVSVVDAQTGAFVASLNPQFPPDPLFSPTAGDHRLIFVGSGPPSFVPSIYADDPTDARERELLADFDPATEFPRSPAWSPDASAILYVVEANDRDHIWRKDLQSGIAQPIFGPHRQVGRPSWGPSRTTLVTAGGHLWTTDARGGSLRRLTSALIVHDQAVFSPDRTRIAFVAQPEHASNTVELFVIDSDGAGVRQLTRFGPGARAAAPEWSPDGERLDFTVDFGYGPAPTLHTLDVDAL